jgi:hypothetical protein
LLSAGANDAVNLWNTDAIHSDNFSEGAQVIRKFSESQLTPTSVAFLNNEDQKFAVGYGDSSVSFFETSGSTLSRIELGSKDHINK